MKKVMLISLLIGALPLSMVAQDDDLYFVPKKSNKVEKVTYNYGQPRETVYSGSNRSVDEYNRRVSSYEPIDSASSDIIDFNGELGVYPDSLEDFRLTKKMERFDDYSLSDNAAYWAGYQQARSDIMWHTPWYYRTYGLGWYGWYDPWYYSGWYGFYDPLYYTSWHFGWWDPWYDYLYYGYYWYNPYYHYNYTYWGGGGNRLGHYNGNAGTINMRTGNMNGRVYTTTAGGTRTSGGTTRLGAQRTTSLRDRAVGNNNTYNRNTNVNSRTTTNSNSTYTPTNRTSVSSSSSGGGFSSGGGGRSSVSSGGGGGGGGARSAGGHAGGRR